MTLTLPPRARLWRLLPMLVALAGIAGLWLPALRSERRIVDRLHEALARHAGAFLAVATPGGAAGGYDAPRLLSGANALANATFWPGELQVALGGTLLVPDDAGLAPLPDSLQATVELGLQATYLERAEERVALVSFRGTDGVPLGWVAAWGALTATLPTPTAIVLSLIAAGAVVAATGVGVLGGGRRRLGVALAVAALAAHILAVELSGIPSATSRDAVQIRLATARQLVEVAATAPQVRQAELPAIALDLGVEPRRGSEGTAGPVIWADSSAVVVAATPRTQGSIALRMSHPDPELAGLPWRMALGSLPLGLALLALGLGGRRAAA